MLKSPVCLLTCAAVFAAPLARADDTPSVAPPPALTPSASGMSAADLSSLMHTWCDGERSSIIPFASTGVAGLAAGGMLLGSDSQVGHAAAWPLLTVGALEILAGIVFAARAGPHKAELDKLLAEDPAAFAQVERAHLHRIRDRFQPMLLIAEAMVTLAGGVTAGAGALRHQDTVTGLGIGIAIQGLALFILDWAVLDRARAYTTALDLFTP